MDGLEDVGNLILFNWLVEVVLVSWLVLKITVATATSATKNPVNSKLARLLLPFTTSN